MIARLLTQLRQWSCAHPHRVRERVDLPGAPGVLHFVCDHCGHRVPAVDRTTVEHLKALRAGRVRRYKARPESEGQRVIDFTSRRQA
jgi:hypothetical protein